MDRIAVLDFGSQYAHLIANRVRRLKVYAEILLPETPLKKLSSYKGLILSGGPQSVYDKDAPTLDKKIFSLQIPILGVCYGHQLIAYLLGGTVSPGSTKEYGLAKLSIVKKLGIFEDLPSTTQVWMSHGDTITKLPPDFIEIGRTEDCPFTATANLEKRIFSTQFHNEVTHTKEGIKILDNFLKICRVKRDWNTERFLEKKMHVLERSIANRNVFLLVSGGVDSTVAYALLSKILGTRRVYGLFIDTGLLRKDEGANISVALKKIGIKNFHTVYAKKQFLSTLKNITAPEEKRRIIGELFLKVQAEAIHRLKLNPEKWLLGQGTIYPDTIESAGTKHADRIKTHHNRIPEILEMIKKGKVIEPIADLYKDEVRALGEKLGLPREIVWRHPFPGPGLAVRILCVSKGVISRHFQCKEESSIREYLKTYGLQGKVLPIQSVGVQGDARTYRHPLVIWGKEYTFDELEKISTALTNRYQEINRVCLLLTPQEILSFQLIPGTLTEKRIQLLQKLDKITAQFMQKHDLTREVWQFPVVLVPVQMNGVKKECVVLRPVCSEEAMTANFYKISRVLLKKLTAKFSPYVSAVLYDITNKPPGTIEWE